MNNQFLKRSFEAWKHALMLYFLKHNLERNCKAKDQLHEDYGLNNDQIYDFNLLLGGGIPSSATAGWPDSPARAHQLFYSQLLYSTESYSRVITDTLRNTVLYYHLLQVLC